MFLLLLPFIFIFLEKSLFVLVKSAKHKQINIPFRILFHSGYLHFYLGKKTCLKVTFSVPKY